MRALLHFLFHAPPIEIHTHSFHIPFHALTVLFKFDFLQFKMKLFKFNLHVDAFNVQMLIFQFIVSMIVMVFVMPLVVMVFAMPTPVVTVFVMAIVIVIMVTSMSPISFVMTTMMPVILFFTITVMPLANGHANPFEPGFLLGKFSILDALFQLFSVLSQIGVRIMAVMPILSIMPAMSPILFAMVPMAITLLVVRSFHLLSCSLPLGHGILFGELALLYRLLELGPEIPQFITLVMFCGQTGNQRHKSDQGQ